MRIHAELSKYNAHLLLPSSQRVCSLGGVSTVTQGMVKGSPVWTAPWEGMSPRGSYGQGPALCHGSFLLRTPYAGVASRMGPPQLLPEGQVLEWPKVHSYSAKMRGLAGGRGVPCLNVPVRRACVLQVHEQIDAPAAGVRPGS